MKSLRNLSLCLGLLLMDKSQTCSAFQPSLMKPSLGRLSTTNEQSLSMALWGVLEGSDDDDKQKKQICRLPENKKDKGLVGYYSTIVLVSLAFLFSPIVKPYANAQAIEPTQESTLLQSSPTPTGSTSIVEEVWNLINKYYIDQTFNGQVSHCSEHR